MVPKSLHELAEKARGLSARTRYLLGGGAVALVLVVVAAIALGGGRTYQYAFTNLTTEDSADSAAALKAAGVPFVLEAGGAALAVPPSRVHEARLLLNSQ